jgi:hypothetical protein
VDHGIAFARLTDGQANPAGATLDHLHPLARLSVVDRQQFLQPRSGSLSNGDHHVLLIVFAP